MKIVAIDEIGVEVRVHRVAMAAALAVVKAGPVVRVETARKGTVRPASAADREQGQAKEVVANRSDSAVISIAVSRANVVRRRRRCRRSMSR